MKKSDTKPDQLQAESPETAAQRPRRSTRTEAQRQRILALLRMRARTTIELRKHGVMQSGTRIHELRKRGYAIDSSERVTVVDDEGYSHRGVASYSLTGEPQT